MSLDVEQENKDSVDIIRNPTHFWTKIRKSQGTPDSPWSFVVLFSAFISTAIVNGCLYSFGVLLPELIDHFEENRARTAIVGSLGTGVGYFLSPLTSSSCERFGFRATVMVSTALSVIALAVSAATPKLVLLYFTYGIIAGTGFSVSHNVSVVMVMKHFVKWRSYASGLIQSAFGVGMLFVSQTTQKLIDWYGWRWALGGWAFLAFTLFLCGIAFDGREVKQESKRIGKNCNKHDHWTAVATQVPSMSSVLRNRLFLLYCLSFALSNMVFYVPIIYMVKFSEKHLSIPRDHSAKLYMYFSVVVIFSRNIYCKLGSFSFCNRFYLYQFSAAFSGVAMLLLPSGTSYVHLVLFMLCLGLLDGGIWGLSALLVTDIAGVENLNFAWGVFNSIASITGVFGPPLAGFIADKCDSYVPAFYASGVTLLVASCLMFLRTCTPRQTIQQNGREILVLMEKNENFEVLERETVL